MVDTINIHFRGPYMEHSFPLSFHFKWFSVFRNLDFSYISIFYDSHLVFVFQRNAYNIDFRFRFMVFNATFNTISVISWRSVLLAVESRVSGETHPPVAGH